MKHITCEHKGCGKTFSHDTRGKCEQALRLHVQRTHLKTTIPPGTEGKPRRSNHDINEFLSVAESRGLDATAPLVDQAPRKYTRRPKETVDVTVNYCPQCGCNLHSVAVGMAMTRGAVMKGAIDAEARKMCKHTVVYTSAQDIACAVQAMQGRTTKAIARELGMSEHMVQHRISKAQNAMKTRFRADYRNSNGTLVKQMMALTQPLALKVVRTKVAPKFIPLAASGVGRLQ